MLKQITIASALLLTFALTSCSETPTTPQTATIVTPDGKAVPVFSTLEEAQAHGRSQAKSPK